MWVYSNVILHGLDFVHLLAVQQYKIIQKLRGGNDSCSKTELLFPSPLKYLCLPTKLGLLDRLFAIP